MPDGVQQEKVALIATDRQIDPEPVTTSGGRDLIGQYASRIAAFAEAGVRVVVLPEKAFAADGKSLPLVATPLSHLAAEHHVDIIVGLVLTQCSLPESLVGSATRRDVLRLAGSAVPSTVTLPRPFTIPMPVPPALRPARSNATTDYYEVTEKPGEAEILPGHTTKIWGHNGV
jgi:hypothetical protein